jgi:hypothetical protein
MAVAGLEVSAGRVGAAIGFWVALLALLMVMLILRIPLGLLGFFLGSTREKRCLALR